MNANKQHRGIHLRNDKYNNTIVVSAVNLVEGGTLSILKKCVQELVVYNSGKKKIVVLVHSKDILPQYEDIEYKEYPLSKKNWMIRMFYEYIYFYFLSLKLKPLIWISLHDMTPNVRAKYLYVYMHNSSPFFQKREGLHLSWKFRLFVLFYKYVYRINVKRNTAVIVQQDWFRTKISELCRIPADKIIVAYPQFEATGVLNYDGKCKKNQFFFNAFPREFKNFEVICEAVSILNVGTFSNSDWDVYLTIDGTENAYSKQVVEKYRSNSHIHFIGIISREQCEEFYRSSECLIFPSLLETWGLPISEFKLYKKKMILADLPYAHEAANGAEKVAFFDPTNARHLAQIVESVIMNKAESFFSKLPKLNVQEPFDMTWLSLFERIIKN